MQIISDYGAYGQDATGECPSRAKWFLYGALFFYLAPKVFPDLQKWFPVLYGKARSLAKR